jgi:hypothetical protein
VPDDERDDGYELKIGGLPQRTPSRTEMIAERHDHCTNKGRSATKGYL